MWQYNYGKEPFDMRLFVLQCMRRLWVVLAGALSGLVLVGGIYYVKNVTFGGVIPYTMDSKYYLEYAVDPNDQQSYSYFASYTWNDLLKSDAMVEKMLADMTIPMSSQELTESFEAELMSDLRICYIHITHVDADTAREIDRVTGEAMMAVGEQQKELLEVRLMDRGEPAPAVPDIRTLRACVLGAVLGTFFALFGLGLWQMLEERVQVPGTLALRYAFPVAGYIDKDGKPSGELAAQLTYLLRGKRRIGVTAVNEEMDLGRQIKILTSCLTRSSDVQTGADGSIHADREFTAIPSLLQVPEAGEVLRSQDGILLLIQADHDKGKTIEEVLRQLKQLDVTVDALVLTEADSRLIRWYR